LINTLQLQRALSPRSFGSSEATTIYIGSKYST